MLATPIVPEFGATTLVLHGVAALRDLLEFQEHVARAADAKRVFQAEFIAADILECAGSILYNVDEALQGGVGLALPLGCWLGD